MRILLMLLPVGLTVGVWADGCTIYGSSFGRISETDQVALIRLEPARVTLDMYIGIDDIPPGQTITYILPFWQRPDGFTMTAMTARDFREQYIYKIEPQFHSELRRVERSAATVLPDDYLTGSLFAFPSLLPVGICRAMFPVFDRAGYGRIQPYASASRCR